MPEIRWYFDFISPFAYLQWRQLLPLHRNGQIQLVAVPILFAAVLDHVGQLGPAEIPGKRAFTYRFVQWQADRSGIPLRFPPAHPFNPIAALRLATAAAAQLELVEAIFKLIWEDGRLPEPEALRELALTAQLGDLSALLASPQVKAQLRHATDAAITRGIYGVPTVELAGELYWGNDATPMVLDALDRPDRWSQPPYIELAELPIGVRRMPPDTRGA